MNGTTCVLGSLLGLEKETCQRVTAKGPGKGKGVSESYVRGGWNEKKAKSLEVKCRWSNSWHLHFPYAFPLFSNRRTFFHFYFSLKYSWFGLSQWLSGKESTCNAGDVSGAVGSIPGSGRSPGKRNGCPRQYSCLENPMDRGAGWAAVHEAAKESDTTERLNNKSWFTELR